LEECKQPKACTILLRGPSKDIINEIERNLQDAMSVARNVVFHPHLAPGGGATEMAVSVGLADFAKSKEGVEVGPIQAVADSMEVIPRTLIQNCGGSAIRTLTDLRAKHANGEFSMGVDGDTGKIVDMKEYGLYESAAVKIQTLKTAIEVSKRAKFYCLGDMLMRFSTVRFPSITRGRCRVGTPRPTTRRRRWTRCAEHGTGG
jgi:T-complex protein 1 subunit gamma